MKKNIVLFGFIGVFVGLLIALATYEGLHRTSSDKFCSVCHEMDPMVAAYQNDVHGGAGHTGIKVKCVECHLPHDSLAAYIYTKARNGVLEGAIHFFGEPEKIDWQKNREKRAHFVYDEGCISCHTTYDSNEKYSKMAQKLHKHYDSLIGTNKEISCASCHVEIGHTGLRSALNYYKPEYEYYEGKLEKERKELEKLLDEKLDRK